jgi:uridine kinase
VDFDRLNTDANTALTSARFVIIDGMFAHLVVPALRSGRLDVYVDLAADLRLARKIHRKCVRDGFPIEVLLTNYLQHRRAAHHRHIEPARHKCDMVVDGELPPEILANQIWSAVDGASARVDPTSREAAETF